MNQIVSNSSTSEEGEKLYAAMVHEYNKRDRIVLIVDNDASMSTSFLNSSVGMFLENFGFDAFKSTVQFKGTQNQFNRLLRYVEKYKQAHLSENYNDFRKGNYFYLKTEGCLVPCQIDGKLENGPYWFVKSVKLSNDQFCDEGMYLTATIEELKPISIFEDEMLIKLGFIEKGGIWSKDDFCVKNEFIDGAHEIEFIDNSQKLTIKFIHELQNLYFDRTGRKLEIKL